MNTYIGAKPRDTASGGQQVSEPFDVKTDEVIMERFGQYFDLIDNLTHRLICETQCDIISCIITLDSSRVITVSQANDEHSIIKQYHTDGFRCTQEIHLEGYYIKAKDVVQNS